MRRMRAIRSTLVVLVVLATLTGTALAGGWGLRLVNYRVFAFDDYSTVAVALQNNGRSLQGTYLQVAVGLSDGSILTKNSFVYLPGNTTRVVNVNFDGTVSRVLFVRLN